MGADDGPGSEGMDMDEQLVWVPCEPWVAVEGTSARS
jgi:hypothetical protein